MRYDSYDAPQQNKAREILDKLDLIPRWLWYVGSLFLLNIPGVLIVYVLFHALEHNAKLQEERAAHAPRQETERKTKAPVPDPDHVVRGEGYEVRNAQPAPERPKREPPRPDTASRVPSYDPIDPEAGVAQVLRQGRLALERIRQADEAIPDPVVSARIDSIGRSCEQIFAILEQRPELLPQLRTFLRYYLPTTLKLLDARTRLEDSGTAKGREVRLRIGKALGEIDRAFLHQTESLEEYRFVDLESEMDVLSEMLRSDGLIDDEEEASPQSWPLGGL